MMILSFQKIEKSLNTSLSFLFAPNYYDYNTSKADIEFMPDNLRDSTDINLEKIKSEASWVETQTFIQDLKNLVKIIESKPNYYKVVDYDREYWLNYLDNDDFKEDLIKLLDFLEHIILKGHKDFTFDMG